ncbi:MAG: hypothetical protein ACXVEF_34260 [Polyangiales bacterium]
MRAALCLALLLAACGTRRDESPAPSAAPKAIELAPVISEAPIAQQVAPVIATIDDDLPAPCLATKDNPQRFQFVDDVCGIKRLPRDEDRDFACPNTWTTNEATVGDRVVSYRPASEGITWDTESLRSLVPEDAKVAAILIRRIKGVPHYRYLSNGSHDVPFQPWSSSKFIAIASAASGLRDKSKGAIGLDATVDLVPVGDIVTAVHTYDEKHYTSNALARWFVDVGGRTRINGLVHDWLGRPEGESLGGGYGPGFVGFGLTFRNGAQATTMPRDPQIAYENKLSAHTLAEALKRLVMHREDASTRLPNARWEDVRTLFYGADKSRWYTEVGGMSADRSVYLQTGADDFDRVAEKAKERFRIFSKSGMGWAQYVSTGYACFPALDDEGEPIANQGHEIVIAARVAGDGGYVENDRAMARIHRAIVQAVLADRL